jgi:hypothetical protein
VRPENLLESDLVSECILAGFGALIFILLMLILVVAWTQAPALL